MEIKLKIECSTREHSVDKLSEKINIEYKIDEEIALELDGKEIDIKDAIKNVKPLCANCHCMVHRNKKSAISVNELKKLIK